MTGTIGHAYRTDVRPFWGGSPFLDRGAAVYVLEPPLLWQVGVTSSVIVACNRRTGVTEVFAAYDTGDLVSPAVLMHGSNHMSALNGLGYEVVHHAGRA
ncbi:hypothetical protein [Nocardia sp. CC227C]|uniref:hypothetical protein n=1 Tax=Nocardia sp. CC227C TaxID=3044562 RepID=UPI00278C75E7|nr:hypothetical protein [Nocardia sp. CC227C]